VKGSSNAKNKRAFTVYIVDDDDSVRNALSRLLHVSGIAARAFESARDFLDAVTAASRGCVLLDMTMLHMTGLDVQAALKDKGVRMPVIVVSANESDQTREAARALGARFFLRKPVDDHALLDAIAWVADKARDGKPQGRPGG
jgi:FixJ family two-component response regulator